jgi:DNA-binding transcriptional ArsR family regulator
MLLYFAIFQCAALAQRSGSSKAAYEKLVSDFRTPAETNHLWCYWYWINDDISKEGISRDLAAMKEAGIGTALIGNINPPEEDGKVPLFSETWWDCMVHAVNEGKRLGVDIGVFNCPGWSQSGGPWVKPEMAMRYLAYSETTVAGPGRVSRQLAKPNKDFQDVCVLAFPAFENLRTLRRENTTIRTTPEVKGAEKWIDGDLATEALLGAAKTGKSIIEFASELPITARSILLYPVNRPVKVKCDFYALVDGTEVLLKSFQFDRSNHGVSVGPIPLGPVAIGLPETKARQFKLVCSEITGANSGFSEIVITERAVLDKFIEKQLGKMHPTPLPLWGSYLWDEQSAVSDHLTVSSEGVLDISDKMDREGNLSWQAPQGHWRVMRIGMTPTGTKNSPAAPQGKGYEIDKANEQLARYHFEQYVGKLQKRIPVENRAALKYVIADSYEMGSQNWTDGFEKRFEDRYGYNPIKWLPVLAGQIVGSVSESERFLWDLRRAVADDVAYEYVGGLRKICSENNLQLWLENYGHWGFPPNS